MRWLSAAFPVFFTCAPAATPPPPAAPTSLAQACPACVPQNEATWRPVQDQLEAYNAHDLEKFLRPYAEDVVVKKQPTGTVLMQGKAAMRPGYADQFTHHPEIVCDVKSRIVAGEWIFDHEFSSSGGDVVAAYHVKDGQIVEVWFFPPKGN
jgi:hypothetical protein